MSSGRKSHAMDMRQPLAGPVGRKLEPRLGVRNGGVCYSVGWTCLGKVPVVELWWRAA